MACIMASSFALSEDADARRGANKKKPTTCSAMLQKSLSKCEQSEKGEHKCRSDTQRKYDKCLKTGTWKSRNETLTLAKE